MCIRDRPYTILVTDPAGNLSIGGIMGGRESEIGDTTTNVLLEAAAWNFINIRRSANALDLHLSLIHICWPWATTSPSPT